MPPPPCKHRTFTYAGLLLARRLRRWPNIQATWARRLVFSGYAFIHYGTIAVWAGALG